VAPGMRPASIFLCRVALPTPHRRAASLSDQRGRSGRACPLLSVVMPHTLPDACPRTGLPRPATVGKYVAKVLADAVSFKDANE